MAKDEKRFTVIHKDGSYMKDEGIRQILVDTKTGVHYLAWQSGSAGGITPLLDACGNVVVTTADI